MRAEEALPIDGASPKIRTETVLIALVQLKGGLSYYSNQETNDREDDHYDFVITHPISPPFSRSIGCKGSQPPTVYSSADAEYIRFSLLKEEKR